MQRHVSSNLSIPPAINILEHAKTPTGLHNLKTFPGGNRHLKRCDPRIKALWRLLVNHCDLTTFEVSANKTRLAKLLNVHPNTIGNWLSFFEKRGWIERPRRYGGRGQGSIIHLLWLAQGKDLYERRQRAEMHQKQKREKQEQNRVKYVTIQQRQKALKKPKDISRGSVIGTMRQVLAPRINNPETIEHCLSVAGRWLFKSGYPVKRMCKIVDALKAIPRIPVPKWAKDKRSIFRWFESLLLKLAFMGKEWWHKLNKKLEAKRLYKLAHKTTEASETGKRCPICKNIHQGSERCSEWAYAKGDLAMSDYREEIRPAHP